MNKQDVNEGMFVSFLLILDGTLIIASMIIGSKILFWLWVTLLIIFYISFGLLGMYKNRAELGKHTGDST